jgi:hypothetical protein
MTYFDIFSSSFLFSISIIIILTGAIFAYVSYRMGEQDHKLNSMIGLISTMAEETHFFRSKLNALQQKIDGSSNHPIASHLLKEELIDVSDDDDETDNDEHEDEDAEDDDDTDDDGDDGDDVDDDEDDDEDNDEEDVNNNEILNVEDFDSDINLDEINMNDINMDDINMEHINSSEVKTVHIDLDTTIEAKNSEDDMGFLKNVSIDLGENDVDSNKHDYKKMSLNKLREVVVSKGVVNDASKLKKNDILKLLGDE